MEVFYNDLALGLSGARPANHNEWYAKGESFKLCRRTSTVDNEWDHHVAGYFVIDQDLKMVSEGQKHSKSSTRLNPSFALCQSTEWQHWTKRDGEIKSIFPSNRFVYLNQSSLRLFFWIRRIKKDDGWEAQSGESGPKCVFEKWKVELRFGPLLAVKNSVSKLPNLKSYCSILARDWRILHPMIMSAINLWAG